ncbi:hypothetical protein DPMN_181187 [Dreissena polymorpha]|uniref:Uncharacterized protein n=1 Tax=Dreissena polymorpha TaxID=45954 RepID=A0A9D4I1C9_DREPO|nr:hypothetical protein DPMN_181187 [Dreissena polymorpha]
MSCLFQMLPESFHLPLSVTAVLHSTQTFRFEAHTSGPVVGRTIHAGREINVYI